MGQAHRSWLEPVRDAFYASGMTLADLQLRTGWPKSKISELLRGAGRYPRWAFARAVLGGLGSPPLPYETMRLLWVLAARAADKRTTWINNCLGQVGDQPLAEPESAPLDFLAFREMHHEHYVGYASTFLCRPALAQAAVDDVFRLLLLLWPDALTSDNPERFAWQVLRQTVWERAPKDAGRPSLVEAAFDTVELHITEDPVGQIEESLTLFRAIRDLAPLQADVIVLLHLRGLHEAEAAEELGVSLAAVRSTERHAKRNLHAALYPDSTTEEGHSGDLSD
ncbi:sigma-70 family RNA polymerase sigma factor [Streptomyces sp. NPDC006879]|uniref:sigma-70 family RNA polymerase sigma factor n=1 Tax=Streptomyces sp. NPDC006879 TaxID=3364767 RepID=UPI0036A2D944